jgi:hypothetical protein
VQLNFSADKRAVGVLDALIEAFNLSNRHRALSASLGDTIGYFQWMKVQNGVTVRASDLRDILAAFREGLDEDGAFKLGARKSSNFLSFYKTVFPDVDNVKHCLEVFRDAYKFAGWFPILTWKRVDGGGLEVVAQTAVEDVTFSHFLAGYVTGVLQEQGLVLEERRAGPDLVVLRFSAHGAALGD